MDHKTCDCGNVFYRSGNYKDIQWRLETRCPVCRKTKQPIEKRLGQYTIKNETIDKFLYEKSFTNS